jgi:uncharacterized protein (DUF2249 family)
MIEKVITLDVREDIRQGREPFTRIMRAAAALQDGESLLLIAPFEPAPLYRIMARQGFTHKSRPNGTGDWEVLFSRAPVADGLENDASQRPAEQASQACAGTPVMELDARGLEPPQPLVAILEALTKLHERAQLRVRTDRRPMHLYAHLEERGFVGDTQALEDGSFVTLIRSR